MTRLSRRQALLSTLFGGGLVGLRALATGLPAAFFRSPRRALAAATAPSSSPACAAAAAQAQYIIFNTSADGDSLNACVPGTYEDPLIAHSPDPALAPAPLMLGDRMVTAAAPWSALSPGDLDRTVFFHLMTNTPVHSKAPEVLRLMGAAPAQEMLPSLLGRHLAPCLGTIQPQPICVGALTPSEALSYGGAALPVVPPLALRATLANPDGPLSALEALRDTTLAGIYDLYKTTASAAQKRYLDALLLSQQAVRSIKQDLLDTLSSIKDNGPDAQVLAAVTLIRMNVSPVVTIHIPFGGDNHHDTALQLETAQSLAGLATLASLLTQLKQAGLRDCVSFLSLNVFGRTLGPANTDGRQHNAAHQTSLAIGKPFRGGVIGAVAPHILGDYGATAIDSTTGVGGDAGDIRAIDTLAAFGQTVLAAVGADPSVITAPAGSARVVKAALSASG